MEQLLTHRKKSHNKTKQFKCRDFKKGACHFSFEECWYNHEDIPTEEKIEDIQNSGFQKPEVNLHPPDLVERIVSMLEMLTQKVNNLEKTQINQ
jgi:hypothetical protein